MLVLSRKTEEKIVIGEDIVITVVRVRGDTVRIGIEAPTSVRILRAELPRFDDEAEATAAEQGVGAEAAAAGVAGPTRFHERRRQIPHETAVAADAADSAVPARPPVNRLQPRFGWR